ncbi:transcription termination factor Rho [Brevibacterium sp. HMSC22B09]|uniref:transcription termination factor Rho n=1 Tax=Brevibacterium sp. HMSC22B09 TaxID=1581055 RepID=UPI0008A49544|nr:transcription termination factor Rho [Brevibacterium sp. HMSC22B09]OFT96841.1 transcription termination factor Rho [Brevibacterium sp. HMSC22B09]
MSENTDFNHSGSLSALRLPQLQEMAAGLGIKGYRRLRKSDLIDAILQAQGGAAQSGADTGAGADKKKSSDASSDKAENTDSKKNDEKKAEAKAEDKADGRDSAEQGDDSGRSRRRSRGGKRGDDSSADVSQSGDGQRGDKNRGDNNRDDKNRDNNGHNDKGGRGDKNGHDDKQGHKNNKNGRGRKNHGDDGDNRNNGDNRDNRGNDNRGNNGDNRSNRHDDGGRDDNNDRGRRGRGRDRKRRRGDDDLRPDDVLIPVSGILDVHDNYAFLRTSSYLPGQNDVYVSNNMVKRNGLRKGDAVVGAIRQHREGERNNRREKFDALVRLDSVNGLSVEDAKRRVNFSKLTPLYPQERLRMETTSSNVTQRIIDLVAPIGKGQRGLIVAPPKAGKTTIMQQIANAVKTNNPDVHLMVVLVDERPEEVTDMTRAVDGEVIASTFDRPADDHTAIAELAIERAKRLVEMGQDVVVLLDNITRLGRAYNLAQPASGRILSGGVDANALYPPKRFFGAARNIEGGGSLTILATALVETGSKMDEVIFEEFKGTGNMELRLSRSLADKRIFPAVDVNGSGTRREENLMGAEERKIMWRLRRVLAGLEQQQALELLLSKLKETQNNAEFLMQVQKTTPLPKAASDD